MMAIWSFDDDAVCKGAIWSLEAGVIDVFEDQYSKASPGRTHTKEPSGTCDGSLADRENMEIAMQCQGMRLKEK